MPTDTILYSAQEADAYFAQEKRDAAAQIFVHDVRTGARKLVTTLEEAKEFFGQVQPKVGPQDPFRMEYRELKDEERSQIAALKNTCSEVWKVLETISTTADKRCIALAKTHLEEVSMWGTKGITA